MFYILPLTYYTTPISQFRYFRQYNIFTAQKPIKTHKIRGIFKQVYMYIYISFSSQKCFNKIFEVYTPYMPNSFWIFQLVLEMWPILSQQNPENSPDLANFSQIWCISRTFFWGKNWLFL